MGFLERALIIVTVSSPPATGKVVLITGASSGTGEATARRLAASEGLRQESRDLRVTIVSPGLTSSDLTESISDADVREAVKVHMQIAIPAAAVGAAVAYAIGQPRDVDVNEIVVRPTAQG